MNSIIKVIAAITMIIDHIGMIFFPEVEVLRIIGRLSLPLFAFCIAEGYKHTKDVKKYIIRVTGFAILAQIPFSIMFQLRLNILFAFALGLLLLTLKDKYGKWVYLFLLPAALLNLEYGIYSILLVIIFHELKDKKTALIAAFTAVTLIYSITQNSVIQLAGIFALYAVYYLKDIQVKIPKYAFYILYPVQWMVLVIIRILLPA